MAGEVVFEKVTGDNVETFKHTIRLCLFPVAYPKSFFRDVAAGKVSAFLLAVGARGVVGCVAWREMKGGPTLVRTGHTYDHLIFKWRMSRHYRGYLKED